MKNQYRQLTYAQRCQISALKDTGHTQRDIAIVIGTSQSTISRELARNTGLRGYRHKQAQARAIQRREDVHRPIKMTAEMIASIDGMLKLDWSPEQISGALTATDAPSVSHECIYLYIWADKKAGGDLYTHLRRQGKKYEKRRNGKSNRGQIKNKVSIDDRPNIVASKKRIGDWEIDTVIGKGHSGALVTIVERVTKYTLSAQVNSKSAADVTLATIKLLKPFRQVVHSITADNGKEFSYHERISKALSADFYFAHPYSSWERGLNENTNGLLRQYFPKSMGLKAVSQLEVKAAVKLLNSRPRKTLGYRTPELLMKNYRAAIAA
jgi:IS30 family transposase